MSSAQSDKIEPKKVELTLNPAFVKEATAEALFFERDGNGGYKPRCLPTDGRGNVQFTDNEGKVIGTTSIKWRGFMMPLTQEQQQQQPSA